MLKIEISSNITSKYISKRTEIRILMGNDKLLWLPFAFFLMISDVELFFHIPFLTEMSFAYFLWGNVYSRPSLNQVIRSFTIEL